ncbi:MAG: hypothetical protein ABL928_08020 [Sphingorhabdus sp.]
MQRLISEANDVSFAHVQGQVYDLQIFASGFESRCTAISRRLGRAHGASTLVLGFGEHRDNPIRVAADQYYAQQLGQEPLIVPPNRPGAIANLLEKQFVLGSEECRILIDISSMSRSWYADVINWAKFTSVVTRVRLDFCYVAGIYPDPYPPRAISEITSLFGFEGRSDMRLETVALLGLGYDAVTPHAVLEDLQPELTFGYIAGNADERSIIQALKLNSATIEELDGPVAVVPLLSVERAYGMLSDMIAPHAGTRNIVLVSLGPKTHVLAGLLIAARNEEVTFLHVHGRSVSATDIRPTPEVAVCSVIFEPIESGFTLDYRIAEAAIAE